MNPRTLSAFLLGLTLGVASAAEFPQAELTNGQLRVRVYLPDQKSGFYRSTRFDWSGAVGSLIYKGHEYYAPWFQKIDPNVNDFGYEGNEVVSAPFTAMVGPAEEFQTNGRALGWDEAKPGGTFIKIGVGVLRKPNDSANYDHSKTYEVVDPGKWTIKKTRDSIQFVHELADPGSGYGYRYTKILRLTRGKPQMTIEHTFENTGTHAIQSSVYDHNFLVLDRQPPGPDFAITFPFQLQARREPTKGLGEIRGNRIVYLKTLEDKDRMSTSVAGFSDDPKDYDIRVENRKVGAGFHVVGDRPLSNVAFWSIKTVLAVEPYIAMNIEPKGQFTWKLTYDYYTLPPAAK